MAFYLYGVHVPHRKNTQKKPIVRIEALQSMTIPMSMHIGKPAVPVVKAGDQVKVGTKIGECVKVYPTGCLKTVIFPDIPADVSIEEILE